MFLSLCTYSPQQSVKTSSPDEPKNSSQSSGECTQELHESSNQDIHDDATKSTKPSASTENKVVTEKVDSPDTEMDGMEPNVVVSSGEDISEEEGIEDLEKPRDSNQDHIHDDATKSTKPSAPTENKVVTGKVDSPDTEMDSIGPNVAAPIEEDMSEEEDITEEDRIQRAIELSLKQQAADEARRQSKEEENFQKACRLSLVHSPVVAAGTSQNGMCEVIDLSGSESNVVDSDGYESIEYRLLTREEFQQCFDKWTERQGGIDKIEKGSLVKKGSHDKDFRKSLSDPKTDAFNMEKAQYGRLSIDALYYILDSLLGDSNGGDLPENVVGPVKAFIDIGSGKSSNNNYTTL